MRGPASRRLVRPASSSPRVRRVAAVTPHTAAAAAVNIPIRHTVKPPAVSRARGAPKSTRMAGFSAISAKPDAACGSAKVAAYCATTAAVTPPITRTRIDAPVQVSRRSNRATAPAAR